MRKPLTLFSKKIVLLFFLVSLVTTKNHAQPGIYLKRMAADKVTQEPVNAKGKTVYTAVNKILSKGNNNEKPGVQLKDSIPGSGSSYQLPATIPFDWEVVQEINGDDGKSTITYYFTTNGDCAGMKSGADASSDLSLMVYAKDGATLMFNDKRKTITIMKMTSVVAEGAQMGKQLAEELNKKPIKPSRNDDMTVSKTGKTKMICGFTADEYLMKNEKGSSSVWYANVGFDPVKIYTMGVGRPADLNKIKNDPRMKNNILAIPVINKNCLMAEMEAGGKKGMETKSITKKTITISTTGYKIIDQSNKSLKQIIREGGN